MLRLSNLSIIRLLFVCILIINPLAAQYFTKITDSPIVIDGGDSKGCSWGDYDGDGDQDLFITNKNDQDNFLYENNNDGTFTKIISGSIVTGGGNSKGSTWGDFDNDGDQDLFVPNGNGENNALYINNCDGTFSKDISSAIVTDRIFLCY